ncbi:MAG TPA: type II secretion system protein [Acidimicrobiia bacterium]|nr:type II secretion system protein [Acidimicrobiia bacterium]
MLEAIRNKRDRDEGFTLIELMVVVLIIAILVAIAVPTFLGARTRSQQKAAQSGARNTLVAAKVKFTDTQTYVGLTTANLAAIEKDLSFVTTDSTGPKVASINVDANGHFFAAVRAADDSCYMVKDNQSSTGDGTTYWKLAGPVAANGCEGADAAALTASFIETGWD